MHTSIVTLPHLRLPSINPAHCRFGKRVPDAFYFWVAVNVSRFPDHEAPKQIPEACKNVANQFKGVLKVQVPPVDYGPATKLLPTLKVCCHKSGVV